jgi:hypothetical protein
LPGNLFADPDAGVRQGMRTTVGIGALVALVLSGLAFAAVALLVTGAIIAAGQYLLDGLASDDRRAERLGLGPPQRRL